MVKSISKDGKNILAKLINNNVLRNAKMFKNCKTDIILLIHKKRDKRNRNNYRAISLSNVSGICKNNKKIKNKMDTTLEDTKCGCKKRLLKDVLLR